MITPRERSFWTTRRVIGAVLLLAAAGIVGVWLSNDRSGMDVEQVRRQNEWERTMTPSAQDHEALKRQAERLRQDLAAEDANQRRDAR